VKDVGGREMRVTFSVDMNPRRRNYEALNSVPKKEIVYESSHKLYVGNLPRDVKPENLRNHFSQFGTLVSARVLHDRKAGKSRCYGFLSFSSAAERDAAISLSGTVEFSSTTTESFFLFHVILCLSYLLHLTCRSFLVEQ
jgi:RNA recognition motif-containing protein